jgi:hypothetical protein
MRPVNPHPLLTSDVAMMTAADNTVVEKTTADNEAGARRRDEGARGARPGEQNIDTFISSGQQQHEYQRIEP